MKRIWLGILAFILLLTGCAPGAEEVSIDPEATTATPEATATPVPSIEREDIADEIGETLSYTASIVVHEKGERLAIDINIPGLDYTHFGDHIIESVRAVEKLYPAALYDIWVRTGEVTFTRGSDDNFYGVYFNSRSGSTESYTINVVDDLVEYFPAAAYYIKILSLSPKASELYLDFSRRLDATPAGSEDTIFQEMAPNYELTPAQLKEYVLALQDFMLGLVDEEPAWPAAEPAATEAPATPAPSAAAQQGAAPAATATPAPQATPTPEPIGGHTIYVTPTGKRYHYDGNCNGGTYIEATLEEAEARGLTPCGKCVQ